MVATARHGVAPVDDGVGHGVGDREDEQEVLEGFVEGAEGLLVDEVPGREEGTIC